MDKHGREEKSHTVLVGKSEQKTVLARSRHIILLLLLLPPMALQPISWP
jgi:hypothetical protein